MTASASEVRRWLSGFHAAERADWAERRRQGSQPARSIALALSLLDAAWTAAGGRYPQDPRRHAEDERVRTVWARLRAGRTR